MNASVKPTSAKFGFDTPVLFIIFNRPETTVRVFEAIRSARPKKLYIAADGPRPSKPGEEARCREARKVASLVDWDCELKTFFRTENLGCGKGPSSAISWFFEFETEGIILEDDCLPDPSFFPFCAQLLERYRHDTRVLEIGGNNLDPESLREKEYSYRFSNHVYIWGWATWRRAWKLHDYHMKHYQEISRKNYLEPSYDTIYERDFYEYVFKKMHRGDERTSARTIWDYQWQFAAKIHSGLTVVPGRNLVVNLGFGENATNTTDPNGVGHDLNLEEIEFPLKHPGFVMADTLLDRQVFRDVCTTTTSRIKSAIKNIVPRPVVDKFLKPIMYMFT